MSDTPELPSEGAPHGEILKANNLGPDQIQVGMAVTSLDGEQIGRVKELGAAEFLIDRRMAHDLWVPYGFVIAAEGHGDGWRRTPARPTDVVLNISAAHIDRQGWRRA